MIRAVLDTSVLVPRGSRRDLQQAASLGLYVALWSPWIIAELNRVLTWQWLEDTRCDLSAENERAVSQSSKRMMEWLLSSLVVVDPKPPYPAAWEELRDPDDEPVWAAAVISKAQCVVSNNLRHYPPADSDGRHQHDGIEYLPAGAFLRLVLGGL